MKFSVALLSSFLLLACSSPSPSSALPTSKDAGLSAEDMRRILEAVREALPAPQAPTPREAQDVARLAQAAVAKGEWMHSRSGSKVLPCVTLQTLQKVGRRPRQKS